MKRSLINAAALILLVAAFLIPFFIDNRLPLHRELGRVSAWAGMMAAAALAAYASTKKIKNKA